MKAVSIWAGLSAAILLAALTLHSLPASCKGAALMGLLFLTTAGLLVKICRGSQ